MGGHSPSHRSHKKSPGASPSMLGLSPMKAPALPPEVPQDLSLPASMADVCTGKVPVLAPVPAAPSDFRTSSLISSQSGVGLDESYSNDEHQLNEFLRLHPMLSCEATSQRTLQLVSGMFEKASIKSCDLICVPKSHDDQFLSYVLLSNPTVPSFHPQPSPTALCPPLSQSRQRVDW